HAKPTTVDQIITSTATTVGGAFSTPVNIVGIVNAGHMHNYPKVAVDPNGNSLAIWYRSDFGGATNTDYINVLVLAATLVSGASISISSLSDVLIIYMYYDGTNSVIQALETDIGGYPLNVYTAPNTISMTNTNTAHPRGSISLTGTTVNVIGVWQSYDSINNTT